MQVTQTLNEISLLERLFAVSLPIRVEVVNGLLEIKLFIRRDTTCKTENATVHSHDAQKNETMQNAHCELSR